MRGAGAIEAGARRGNGLPPASAPGEFDDYRLLLELAGDLRQWRARNPVFRRALDHTADELVRLAARGGAG